MAVEAKRAPNSAHLACVSLAMVMCMKQSKTLLSKDIGLVKDAYAELIEDWSSKKSSKVHALLFDDVVTRVVPAQGGSSDVSSSHSVVLPGTAASLVLGGIVAAMGAGRSDFIKSEAFRVGSKIFQDTASVVDNAAVRKACEACGEMLTFEGGVGLKSKRIKDVLLFVEKIINYGKKTEAKKGFWNVLGERMTKGLTDASTSSHPSDSVKNLCKKYITEIEDWGRNAEEEPVVVVVAPKSASKKAKTAAATAAVVVEERSETTTATATTPKDAKKAKTKK